MGRDTGQSSAGFHRLKSFMRCKQAFAFHEVLGLVPAIENEYSGRGTVLHECLRAHYLDRDVETVLQSLPGRYGPHIAEGRRIYEAYLRHYGPADREGFRVLAVEEEYEVKIAGYSFTRRLDLVLERQRTVGIMDHKTAMRPNVRGATASDDWSLATQEIVGRVLLPEMYGLPYGGFTLNLIGPGAAEVTFLRRQIDFAPRMLDSIPRSLLAVYREIEALEGTDPWLYPRSGACREGFKCDYLPLCNGGKAWARQYEVTR